MAYRYLGRTAKLHAARKRAKKYSIFDPVHEKWVDFGQMGYEDFTKHRDKTRRTRYLARSAKLPGSWKRNPYSANNLSRAILWSFPTPGIEPSSRP